MTFNMFKTLQKNPTLFRIDEEYEFPELGTSSTVRTSTDLNFKEIVSRETVIEKGESLKPGWIQFKKSNSETFVTFDKKMQTLTQYFEDEEDEGESNDVLVLEQLMSNWNRRRVEYDDIHGEGEYEKLYPILDDEDEDELDADDEWV
jgi:hypothetical protein